MAAGVSAIALGTDGGGSIRAPCSLTGLVGIKANFARIPVWPASATPTLSHVGPIARTVDDAALLLSVCAAPDIRDPFSLMQAIGDPPNPEEISRLRVAFSPTLGYGSTHAPVAAAVNAAVNKLHASSRVSSSSSMFAPKKERFSAPNSSADVAHGSEISSTALPTCRPPLLAAIRAFRATTADRFTRLLRRRRQHARSCGSFSRATICCLHRRRPAPPGTSTGLATGI